MAQIWIKGSLVTFLSFCIMLVFPVDANHLDDLIAQLSEIRSKRESRSRDTAKVKLFDEIDYSNLLFLSQLSEKKHFDSSHLFLKD